MHTDDIQALAGKKMLLEVRNTGQSTLDWCGENKRDIDLFLSTEGALLIRGLPVKDGTEFEKILEILFEDKLSDYVYRSTPRTKLKNSHIYTASEYHPSEVIPQHNENAYSNVWPMRIGFLCEVRAVKMGNTPISDSRVAYQRIPEEIREEFRRKKIMYVRNYSDIDLPWTEVFQTESREEVEKFCTSHHIQFEWTDMGLRTRQVNQAVISHPVTKEILWFNQAHLFHVSSLQEEVRNSLIELVGEEYLPRNTYFGDGTPISAEALSIIREVYERTKFSFQWQEGDVLLLDNMLFTHGREPFEGPRRVLVGMGRKYSEK